MSLSAFLAKNAAPVSHGFFAVSPRVLGEDGEPERWEIRSLTAAAADALGARARGAYRCRGGAGSS